jgi:hypothetical protein
MMNDPVDLAIRCCLVNHHGPGFLIQLVKYHHVLVILEQDIALPYPLNGADAVDRI